MLREKNFIEDICLQSCSIYKFLKKGNNYLKINYCREQNKIIFYYYSVDVEPLFQIAEICTSDNSYILYNKGISEYLDFVNNFCYEKDLLEIIIKSLNEFVVTI